MADSLVIHHPKPDRPVRWLGFVAHGAGPKGKIHAVVIDLGKKWGLKTAKIPGKVYLGKVLKQPPNWGVAFKVRSPGTYMLVVKIGLLHHASVIFRVVPRQFFGLTISSPAQGEDVERNVWAYGGFSNETSVSGTLTCQSGGGPHVYRAGPLPVMPPMTIWYLGFEIPATEPDSHNPFELVVTSNLGTSATQTGINVLNLP